MDDPEEFSKWVSLLWEPVDHSVMRDHRIKGWVSTAVSKKSYQCLKEWVTNDPLIRKEMAQVSSKAWDDQMITIMLGNNPSEDVQAQMIWTAVKNLNEEMVDEYEKRKLSIAAANKNPLICYAVSLRNEPMVKKLLALGVDPTVAYRGTTPTALATKMNFVAALKLLPVDVQQKEKLEAFQSKYPGDPKAAWLGAWTNGKSEFNTVSMLITGDGNGTLYSAVGIGMPFVWKAESKTKVMLFPVTEAGVILDIKWEAVMTAEGLNLSTPKGNTEKMARPKKQ